MGGRTYAYNSIIIGFLLGIWAWAATNSVFLGILAAVGASVIGFIAIRALEGAIGKGVDAASDAAAKALRKKK